MLTYEEQLASDLTWGFMEASKHFDENSKVFQSLHKITRRLTELGIPYAVVGGMALFTHGVRRFTEDVDLLLTPAGLAEAHRQLDGLGYTPPFKGSKQLCDAENGVRIKFLVSGQFPGDGKPKPVAFPDPADAGVEMKGMRFLRLEKLVELKLASGMTGGVGRMKDLTDVVELIKVLRLPAEFSQKLNPYVRDKFMEIWNGLKSGPVSEHGSD
jgi:hypothetical protein